MVMKTPGQAASTSMKARHVSQALMDTGLKNYLSEPYKLYATNPLDCKDKKWMDLLDLSLRSSSHTS